MARKYRKRAPVVEAVEYSGANLDDALKLCPHGVSRVKWSDAFVIHSEAGDSRCDVGDYVVKGEHGTVALHPEVFKEMYEEVDG